MRSTAMRSTWKGAIRLSLITIPVRVFPATASSDVSFRQLHRKCRTPIQLKKWCPVCEEEVAAGDIVKGYETSRGHFVVVEEEDIRTLRPESTHVVDIGHVIDANAIDPVSIERSYFLAPEGKTSGPAFAVFRDSLEGRATVGRLALHGREYLVAVLARGQALVMYTLRTAEELRDVEAIEELGFASARTKPDEVRLARQVLRHFEDGTDLKTLTDHYQEALREMLASKTPEEAVVTGRGKAPGNVVDLKDALRRSLERIEGKAKARPRPHVVHHASRKRAS